MWMLMIGLALIAWAVLTCHELVRLRLLGRSAWSDLSKPLARRDELGRQLAEAVKDPAQGATDEETMRLRLTLNQLEETVHDAARYYNTLVQDYNARLAVFPDRLIAHAWKLIPQEPFPLPDA